LCYFIFWLFSANPGKKSSKPVSRPGVENKSEVKGAFIINDSLRNELLKLPDLVRPSGSSGHIITPVVPVLLPPPVTTTQVSLTPPSNLPSKKDHEVFLPQRNVVAVEEIPRFYRESSPPTEFTAKSVPASGKIAEEPQIMSLIEQKRQQWAKERGNPSRMTILSSLSYLKSLYTYTARFWPYFLLLSLLSPSFIYFPICILNGCDSHTK